MKIFIKVAFLIIISTLASHKAFAEPTVQESIIGLYVAYYNRAPDQGGLNHWNNVATANGNSAVLLSISEQFMNHPKFEEDYPSSLSTIGFVTKIYQNMLNRAPDTEGLNFWVTVLDNGLPKSKFIVTYVNDVLSYTGTDPAGIISTRMFSNKTNVGEYYVDTLGVASNGEPGTLAYSRSIDALACVTEHLTTVDSAKALIANYLTTEEPIENSCVPSGTSSIAGVVKESITNHALPGVQVKLYYNELFLTEISTDSTGTYSFENLQAGPGYSLILIKADYLSEDYNSIEIQADEIKYLETILQINNQYAGVGNITGSIRNALDGNGVSDLKVDIRKGINTRIGAIIKTVITKYNGTYDIANLQAGNYTGEISGTGYQTNYFTIIVLGGITNEEQNGVVNPVLVSGEMRIVLSWGTNPYDLDSHLTGPTSNNSSDKFHVYFYEPTSTYINLDRDDVSSYGPETTTVQQQFEGLYRYSIHDYTNGDSSSSNALANSRAQVKVYNNNGLIAEFNVPNQAGTLWTVFEMRDSQITPVNNMTYLNDISAFRATGNRLKNNDTDAYLLKKLPSKLN